VERPSIKDVAQAAGVSVGTVSNVLNRPSVVAEATRTRVEAAIADLGFVRNESARQLRAGRSRTLAYLAIDASNPFFTDVALGIEKVARESHLSLFLCNSDHDPAREREYLDLLLQHRVLGLLITPVDPAVTLIGDLQRHGIPVVLLDRAEHLDVEACSVSVDDVEGGYVAVSHLIEGGHQQIAFVGGPIPIVQVTERLAGARKAMSEHGLAEGDLTVLETSALSVGEGRRAGQRLLGVPARRRPTAVFCANDLLALGILQEMTQAGVPVPEEMAIVGYDDIEFAAAAAVPLTSVQQPRQQLGRTAMELLLEETRDSAHQHRHIQFTPELVVRQSTLLGPRQRPAPAAAP